MTRGVVYEMCQVVRQALDLHEMSTNQPIMTALEVRAWCSGKGGVLSKSVVVARP